MNKHMGSRSGWLAPALLAALLASSATGCVIESDGPFVDDRNTPYLGDLEVNWTLLGSDAPSRCARYGIDRWVVLADGPEEAESVVSCEGDTWTTADDLFALAEGTYDITLTGIDRFDRAIVETALRTPLVDDGRTLVIDIDLLEDDFLP